MDPHEQVVVESRGENTSTTEVVETNVSSDLGTTKSIEIDTKMTSSGPSGQQLSELIQLLETCQLGNGGGSAAALQQNLISALLNENATKVAVSSSSSSNSVSPQQQQQSSNSSPSSDNANLLALAQIMLQKQQQQLAQKSKSPINASPVKSSSSGLLNPASNTMQQALDSIYNMNGNGNNSNSNNNAAVLAAAQLLKASRSATNGSRNASSTENLPSASSNTSSPPLSSNQPDSQLLLELIKQDPSQLEQWLKCNILFSNI